MFWQSTREQVERPTTDTSKTLDDEEPISRLSNVEITINTLASPTASTSQGTTKNKDHV